MADRYLTEEEKNQIRYEYMHGTPVWKLAQKYDVSERKIVQVLGKY